MGFYGWDYLFWKFEVFPNTEFYRTVGQGTHGICCLWLCLSLRLQLTTAT